jgi:anhydro-N-acetylmuramic acid kinase
MLLIGLMSGTSADGIDAALVEIDGEGRSVRVQLRQFLCVAHTPAMRHAILYACNPEGAHTPDLCTLNGALGEKFAEAARAVAAAASVPLSDVNAIASHGQTVWHQPEPVHVGGVQSRGTLQLGDPAIIAARTGCRVVSDFRSADMAAGGQGAPLVPYFDWAVLTSDTESRAVLNIGGIANVTHLPRGARIDDVIAFDTGPGNMVIDELAYAFSQGRKTMDKDGAWASKGTVAPNIVEFLIQQMDYFQQPPPKSTGREVFGGKFVEGIIPMRPRTKHSAADLIATMTAFTAETIAHAFQTWLKPRGGVDTVVVGGGGVHNKTLMRMLEERLAPARITSHQDLGIPNDAKEAMAFALLGYETLHGRPSNVPSATGATRPAILGSITPRPL